MFGLDRCCTGWGSGEVVLVVVVGVVVGLLPVQVQALSSTVTVAGRYEHTCNLILFQSCKDWSSQ